LWRPAVWSEIRDVHRALRAQRYDAVVDTQSLIKSAFLARLASGRHHGMDWASAREPLASILYGRRHAVPRAAHAVERNRQLAAQSLGYVLPGELDYGLRVAAAERKSGYVVLLTMTSRADKLWPDERWIELARALRRPTILPWGSAAEHARARRIADAVGGTVPSRMDLQELARLFGAAHGVIGLDTGLTHLAAALGKPTVGIYCGSDPVLTGLYGSPHAANVGEPGRMPEAGEVLQLLA
jgi:heptosyltransferase I